MTRTQLDSESPWVPAPVSLSLLFFFFKVLKILLNFYCSLADLQCCVSSYCIASGDCKFLAYEPASCELAKMRPCVRTSCRVKSFRCLACTAACVHLRALALPCT